MNYTHLQSSHSPITKQNLWPGLTISETTAAKRGTIKKMMDEFTSFTWRGFDAFENFGAFVINNKDSLKFYNGPGFSNEYTKPQFTSGTHLSGVNFNTQQIKFKIGVYWIDIEGYRKFLSWLSPYEIGTLSFGFAPLWGYQVKLASISDSPRYVVGNEFDTDGKHPMYYTEMDLTFDIQGQQCATSINPYRFDLSEHNNMSTNSFSFSLNKQYDFIESEVSTPFAIEWNIPLCSEDPVQKTFSISATALIDNNAAKIPLFEIDFEGLTWSTEVQNANTIQINYDSESGICYLGFGDGEYQILSLINTAYNGARIVKHMKINKFVFPGAADIPDFWDRDIKINFTTNMRIKKDESLDNESLQPHNLSVICHAKTNAI